MYVFFVLKVIMPTILFHIWGPIAIHSYGFFIVIGLIIFMALVTKDTRFKKLLLKDVFIDSIIIGTLSAIIGGRILYVASEKEAIDSTLDFFAFWQGGLSILGGVIGALLGVSLFLWYKKIPILPFFDLIAIYAPLLQALGRIGCFYAGCCYGLPCNYSWAIKYTDDDCYAPLHVAMHPTQLYSATMLFILFLVLFLYVRHKKMYAGFMVQVYLFCIALERCILDFWRADRCMHNQIFSYNQYIALGLILLSSIGFAYCNYNFLYKKH